MNELEQIERDSSLCYPTPYHSRIVGGELIEEILDLESQNKALFAEGAPEPTMADRTNKTIANLLRANR